MSVSIGLVHHFRQAVNYGRKGNSSPLHNCSKTGSAQPKVQLRVLDL